MKFKVGDRVKFVKSITTDEEFLIDEYGTILVIGSVYIGVEFENKFDECHNLDGNCKDNYGWWCDKNQLILVEQKSEKSSIYFDLDEKYICIHILLKNGVVIKDMFEVNKKESSDRIFKNFIEALQNNDEEEKFYITTPNNLVVDVEDISAVKVVEDQNKHLAYQDVFGVIL